MAAAHLRRARLLASPEPFRAWAPLLCIDIVASGRISGQGSVKRAAKRKHQEETPRGNTKRKRQEETMSRAFRRAVVTVLFTSALIPIGAHAAWQPNKPIEFVATAGPGGGTDIFA